MLEAVSWAELMKFVHAGLDEKRDQRKQRRRRERMGLNRLDCRLTKNRTDGGRKGTESTDLFISGQKEMKNLTRVPD